MGGISQVHQQSVFGHSLWPRERACTYVRELGTLSLGNLLGDVVSPPRSGKKVTIIVGRHWFANFDRPLFYLHPFLLDGSFGWVVHHPVATFPPQLATAPDVWPCPCGVLRRALSGE